MRMHHGYSYMRMYVTCDVARVTPTTVVVTLLRAMLLDKQVRALRGDMSSRVMKFAQPLPTATMAEVFAFSKYRLQEKVHLRHSCFRFQFNVSLPSQKCDILRTALCLRLKSDLLLEENQCKASIDGPMEGNCPFERTLIYSILPTQDPSVREVYRLCYY